MTTTPPPTILEIGTRVTRFGIAGHAGPRITIATPPQLLGPIRGKLTPRPNLILYPFLQRYCFANVSVTGIMYLIHNVEDNVRWVRYLKEVLSRIFHASQVILVPAPIACVHSSGLRTGVSLDIGAESSRCCVVVHGVLYPNPLHAIQLCPTGTDVVTRRLVKAIKDVTGVSKLLEADLSEGLVVENAVVRYATVCPKGVLAKTVSARLKHATVVVNPSTAAECFFDDTDTSDDELTLPHMILRALLLSDCVVRRDLAANIVVSGGGACIPGTLERIAQEMVSLLEKDTRYAPLLLLRPHIRFFVGQTLQNQLAYMGCSVAVVSS